MAVSPTVSKVITLIKEPIENLGLSLWDVRFVKEGASWYLRIYIDKDGGVDINDCTDVSRLIDPIIDQADPINVSYYMEVCSPGIDRELILPEHFEKFIGSNVRIRLIRPQDNQKEFLGTLVSYNGDVKICSQDLEMTFAKSDISWVKLDF